MMDRPVVTIPLDLMRVLNVNWDIEWRGQPGAETVGGVTVATYNRLPRFAGSPSLVLPRERLAQWRGIRGYAAGRTALYRVPMIDPVVTACGVEIPFSEGQYFSAGQGFAYTPTITLIDAAAAGDSEITVDETGSDFGVQVGAFLSFNLWPFLVTSRIELGSGIVRLGVQMLRTAIPAGGLIHQRAHGLFTASDDQMGNPSYGLDLVARPQLSLVEYISRD